MYQAGIEQKSLFGARRVVGSAVLGSLAMFAGAGCGSSYRPVVSAINPVGPASQPTKYVVAVSNPNTDPTTTTSSSIPGLLTFVDFSGDTVLSTPSVQVNPRYFGQQSSGVQGYTISADSQLYSFGESNPTALLTTNIQKTTLPASPIELSAISIGSSGTTLFVPEVGTNKVAELNNVGPSLVQELSVAPNPVYVFGADGAERAYIISQNTSGNGVVSAVESGTLSVSSQIPVGQTPVYGVMSSDGKRAFVLNKASGTVNVINVVNNALDTTPVIPATGTLGVNPVWADLNATTNELAVLNAGNGTTAGTLSLINIPLCTSITQTTNPNCSTTNPVDAVGFGTVYASVPVGINPTMVSILKDGSRAYVSNQLDSTGKCNAGEGSVTVVNMTQGVVETTICSVSTASLTNTATSDPGVIYGHPNNIVTGYADPTGKVYVTSWDNRFISVIYTDTDSVQTHIPIQGYGIPLVTACPVTTAPATCAAGLPAATQVQPVGLRITAQ